MKHAHEVVKHEWNFEGQENTLEVIQTAALLVAALELMEIRSHLEALEHSGLYEIVRDQKKQIPPKKAKRPPKRSPSVSRKGSA